MEYSAYCLHEGDNFQVYPLYLRARGSHRAQKDMLLY